MKIISKQGGKTSGSSSSSVRHPRAASAVTGKGRSAAKAVTKARHGNGNGNGNGRGNGHGAAAPRRPVLAQPHYNEGLRYDSPGLHYADDTPVPVPVLGTAKVRLELAGRSDSDLGTFADTHIVAMAGNVNFPTPIPTTVVFGQAVADFKNWLMQYETLKVQIKNVLEQKDAARAVLQSLFAQRGGYIDVTSNGNGDIIASSALPVRRAPTPVGQLPWPSDLVVELTQVSGQFLVRWMAVASAKGYLLQCAEVVAGEPRAWVNAYTGGKFSSAQKDLTAGKNYEFRVAALGGSTGQSDFSPVVARMAA